VRRLPITVLVLSTLGAKSANTFASLALDLWMFEPLNRRRAPNFVPSVRRAAPPFDEQSACTMTKPHCAASDAAVPLNLAESGACTLRRTLLDFLGILQ
jgi:hypothetical protein